MTFGNSVVTSYAYDPVSRLSSLTNNLFGAANDITIGNLAYNPASQIVSAPRSNDAYSWNGSVAVNRNYSSNGLNQYTAAGTANFTYDARGNLTSDGTNSYGYSSENLLTSAPGTTLTYDPMMRLYQVAGTATSRFAYDGVNMIADYDGANALQHRYVFGPGADEPIVEYAGSGTATRTFLSSDERGSIIARSNGIGSLATANSYDEYGIPGSGNAGLFQYTGQAWLSQIGMQYSKARIYSPTLGRFMQTDPIGYDGDGPNLYAYVLNDPVNNVDPLGLALACVTGPAVNPATGNVVPGSSLTSCSERYPSDTLGMYLVLASVSDSGFSGFVGGGGGGGGGIGAVTGPVQPKSQPVDQKKDQCQVTQEDSANTAATGGAFAAIPEFLKLGVNVAKGVGIRGILIGAGVEASEGALAVFGGPVTLAIVGVSTAIYAYDRYSGGKATRFVNRTLAKAGVSLEIGSGCK